MSQAVQAPGVALNGLHAIACDTDDSGSFSALGDLVVIGSTRSNVNYFRAILIA